MKGSNVMETWTIRKDEPICCHIYHKPRVGTHFLAFRADKCTLILALEKIDDDAVVPLLVTLPRLLSKLSELQGPPLLPIGILDVGLLEHTIEILVKAVE